VGVDRLAQYRDPRCVNNGRPPPRPESEAQVLGGQSYLEDNDMSRWIRMALLGPVGMGSNNIQRSIISSMLGLQLRDLK